ncbi:cytochrome oxidase small assembly protein [Pseudorhodoferax sp. Leaf274]|nr:cytochrome oxidase small assembly protein [Pseudorhodoferax sp. Leaf274]
MTPDKKKQNLRTGLILLSVALAFFVGFMVKMVYLGRS